MSANNIATENAATPQIGALRFPITSRPAAARAPIIEAASPSVIAGAVRKPFPLCPEALSARPVRTPIKLAPRTTFVMRGKH
jgi:hypothetical protein